MEAVHAVIVQMEEGERARLKRWVDMTQSNADRMRVIFFLALIFVAAFFGVLFLLIRREMAERKRVQNKLAQFVTELKAANDELKNFAYIVSHDLKAPLRGIGSLADWLVADQAEKLDDEGREHLRLITQRVRRMDGLIDGILQYSRVGRIKETLTEVDLNQLLRDVIDSLAPPENIAIRIAGALPTIRTEKTRIQQVFQNLLSNAIKYMDKPQGEIRIACVSAGEDWEFSISDNGPGIETRHFKRIFQLFQTLAPHDRVKSTGVGLALVKKIVEQYGGKIWLESKLGEGSTFFFTLPKRGQRTLTTKGESR
ncbi:MAG: GHKL domain-containing protein [Hydrogenophilales bacterium]|nr:GHKL domain-containing protein [Hydrogenophilales bacterium]